MSASFDANRAAWLDGAPPDTPSAALSSDVTADIAIIGGGFTGVSAAYHLAKRAPGKRIVLVEAKQLGNGATGRNGGLVLNGITVKDHPPELAVREYAITNAAIDAIEALLREHRLAVRFRRTGCVSIATTAAAAEAQHAWVEQLAQRGVPLQFLDRTALATKLKVEHAFGATFDPGEAMIAGVDLVRAMRPVLLHAGVQIYEDTIVERIREGATCEVVTRGGTIRAAAIVLATSAYTPRLGYFKRGIVPVLSHVIATAPVPEAVQRELGLDRIAGFFDDSPRLAYGGLDFSGRVVFGGGSTASYGYGFNNATTFGGNGERGEHAVRGTLARYFPALADLPTERRWTGPIDLTLVRHCAIGVTGTHRNVYYGVGYSGHGITLANLAGRVIADLFVGDDAAWRDCAFYMRRPSGIPPEPLRWLGYHAYTRFTGKSPYKKL